jgi:hypothetical protein
MVLSVFILLALSIFSGVAWASSISPNIRFAVHLYAPDGSRVPNSGVTTLKDYAKSVVYAPTRLQNLNYVPLSVVDLTATFNFTGTSSLTGTVDSELPAAGDQYFDVIQRVKTSSNPDTYAFVIRTLPINRLGTWDEDDNYVGIISPSSSVSSFASGPLSGIGTVNIASTYPTYKTEYALNANSAASFVGAIPSQTLVAYPNPAASYAYYDLGLATSYGSSSEVYPDGASTTQLLAGQVYRFSIDMAFGSNGSPLTSAAVGSVTYVHTILFTGAAYRGSFSSEFLGVRNVGTDAEPVLEYISRLSYTIAPLKDGLLTGLRFTFYPNTSLLKWHSLFWDVDLIESDAAVVQSLATTNSLLASILSYYEQNPPQADDISANVKMQEEISQAAFSSASDSFQSAILNSDPSAMYDPILAITLGSAVMDFTGVISVAATVFPFVIFLFSMIMFCLFANRLLNKV